MIKSFFILLIFLNISVSYANCEQVTYQFIENKKIRNKKTILCLKIKDKLPLVYSKNCSDDQCLAVENLKEKKKLRITQTGSPHFRLCHEIGGFPLKVKLNKLITTRKTMLCIFKEDGSILNTEALLKWSL